MPEQRIQFIRVDAEDFACRGRDGCGALVLGEDRQRHSRHHSLVLGTAEQIETQGNNAPFLDPAQDPEPGNFYNQDPDPPIDQTQVMPRSGRRAR